MDHEISAARTKAWLHDGDEIALLDVREAGQFGEGHPLFAVPLPYSRLEARIGALVPRLDTRIVLLDDADGVARRASDCLAGAGYSDVYTVAGGASAWADAGYTLYQGVNVPSKALGELVEHAWRPPTVNAATLYQWRTEGRAHLLFDARPPAEYAKMRIPGALCLPNGELAHRFPAAVSDAAIPVVVTCAGRTRSLVGVLGLQLAGITSPIHALENGTQGWVLAGHALERGNQAACYPSLSPSQARQTRERADRVLAAQGIDSVDARDVQRWREEPGRTTYLFDLRSPEEIANDPAPAFVPALSGQLVQAADQWIGVRHARLVLLDDLGLRGAIAAFWLRQLGFEVAVVRVDDTVRALVPHRAVPAPERIACIDAAEALARHARGTALLLDVRGSAACREARLAGVPWGVRPRLDRLALERSLPVYLVGEGEVAALAARECRRLGHPDVSLVAGGVDALVDAGATLSRDGNDPGAEESIDFLWFVHDRHDGNLAASRRYLAWEQGLVEQLDDEERAEFRIAARSPKSAVGPRKVTD